MTAADQLRGGVTTIEGCRLVHLSEGDGPSLVFAHGGMGRGSSWLGVADQLRDTFTCHLLDLRGHGASDWGGGPDVTRAAHDLLEAVGALAPVRAVIGHSYGALVALEAARLVDRSVIPRLVVYEPPLALTGPIMSTDTLATVEQCVAAGEYEAALLHHLGAASGGMKEADVEMLRTNPMLRSVYADLVIQAPSIGLGVRAANALSSAEPYRTIDASTLILLGTESLDHPFRSAAEALVDVIPDARIAPLDGQGHVAQLMAPHLLADAIRTFAS